LVNGDVLAMPLLQEVVKQVVRAGGRPTLLLTSDELHEVFLREADPEQLAWLSPLDELMAAKLDVRIVIRAASNTRSLTSLDPARQQIYQNARRPLSQAYMDRTAAGEHRWVGTLFPCPAYAQEADMSLTEYEDFVYAATYADQPDPVRCWQEVHDRQQRLVDWLQGKDRVEVRGPHIDLSLSIAGRSFVNSDGKRNMPSGEIFTGPVEESVNGWIRFDYPAIFAGRAVEGVELRFVDGAVVEARADREEEFLRRTLDSDPGARFLGEFAVGTNDRIRRFTRSILFDEKIGGTIHVAVGAGYPETGSRNRSRVHWDFICDMRHDSEIRVDGELFYRNGRFLLEEPDPPAPPAG
jgi:aminopeptidase